jgi:RNA polymerase sigma factor (sigma-70 family)
MEAAEAAQHARPQPTVPARRLSLRRQSADRAFERLYEKHVADVYQYALAVLTNPSDAEDVTQTTFMNAYRAFQRGERPLRPHNWLIKIAHNVCRMRWREASSRPQEVPLENIREPSVSLDETPDVRDVLRALGELPFTQRAALVMRELEGRKYSEIAEVLGTSVPAVEALLFRARRRLQVRRKALSALSSVPLPSSLSSFLGGSSGTIVAGGAAVGMPLALKAAALIGIGVVASGVGYAGAKKIAASYSPAPVAVDKPLVGQIPLGGVLGLTVGGQTLPGVGSLRVPVRDGVVRAGDGVADEATSPATEAGSGDALSGGGDSGSIGVGSAGVQVGVQAPTATTGGGVPNVPVVGQPTAPTAPSAPAVPTAPTAPAAPAVPVPDVPSAPSPPHLPNLPPPPLPPVPPVPAVPTPPPPPILK